MLQLLATMVTYLVVLLQFQISIPDEGQGQASQNDENSYNITNIQGTTESMTASTTVMTTILTTLAKKKKKN